MDGRVMRKNALQKKPRTLLSRTLGRYLACVTAVFLVNAPLFYLILHYFYADAPEDDIMVGMTLLLLLNFVVISVSYFITLRFATHSLWHPFDDTLRKTERFNIAKDEVPHFNDTDISEFNRLNSSLEQLMKRDHESFRIQKELTENASHELQTPLAVIRSKLDLLMQEEMNERQMNIVSDLYNLTMRMSHLNRNLLLLAKIDNAQYAMTEEVDIATLLADTLPMYGALQSDIPIKVSDRRSAQGRTLKANTILLECLLKNLIVNALRHTASGGDVTVTLIDRTLTVSNTACGGALREETLFRRFRSGEARQSGTGLGLAIVRSICDFHNWTVTYSFAEGRHTFCLGFRF